MNRTMEEAIIKKDGKVIEVHFDNQKNAGELSDDQILMIANQAKEADSINIHEVVKPNGNVIEQSQVNKTNFVASQSLIEPRGVLYKYSTSKTFSHRSPMKAILTFSVARGETYKIKQSVTIKNEALISGTISAGAKAELAGELNNAVTYVYQVGRKLTGPPKGYSSRQYYSTKFADYGKYK